MISKFSYLPHSGPLSIELPVTSLVITFTVPQSGLERQSQHIYESYGYYRILQQNIDRYKGICTAISSPTLVT